MFFYTKIKYQIGIGLFLILFFFDCKKSTSNQNESYESYIRSNTHKMCEKLVSCFTSITRTFPVELQNEVNMENCEKIALVDLDEKIKLHTESMKTLSKGCYKKLLESECKYLLTFAFADTSCYMLKKESDSVYAKANLMKKEK